MRSRLVESSSVGELRERGRVCEPGASRGNGSYLLPARGCIGAAVETESRLWPWAGRPHWSAHLQTGCLPATRGKQSVIINVHRQATHQVYGDCVTIAGRGELGGGRAWLTGTQLHRIPGTVGAGNGMTQSGWGHLTLYQPQEIA